VPAAPPVLGRRQPHDQNPAHRLIELVCSRINAQAVCNACLDGSQCDICGLAQRCKAAKKPSIQLSELVAKASAVKSRQTLRN
jgi:hypothetical protein